MPAACLLSSGSDDAYTKLTPKSLSMRAILAFRLSCASAEAGARRTARVARTDIVRCFILQRIFVCIHIVVDRFKVKILRCAGEYIHQTGAALDI